MLERLKAYNNLMADRLQQIGIDPADVPVDGLGLSSVEIIVRDPRGNPERDAFGCYIYWTHMLTKAEKDILNADWVLENEKGEQDG